MLSTISSVASHPDKDLFDLVQRWHAAYDIEDSAHDAWTDAEERFDKITVEIPEAVYSRRGDFFLLVHCHHAEPCGDGSGRYWHANNIEILRTTPQTRPDLTTGDCPPAYRVDKQAQARADEIVAAWDAYKAAINEACRVSGEADAAEAVKVAVAHREAIDREIINYRAKTLEGLKLRLDILARLYGGEDEFADVARYQTERDAPRALPYAILRDLTAILQVGSIHQVHMLQAAE
ncbi:hypothetical protein [Chelatococcus sp.]|uniref:hypothetical protein n=1 Tax=Chelatococcus sp. TaxID=1953771 RepID=UPI001EB2E1AB|nr:hypothetical protein [Chelatococcus sp.]MBX3546876.1 hypothetical protein [Chelatococcus sp.]